MTVRILTGDCRTLLKSLPDASVHTCVTSPPYYGLRDYGTAQWEGGDAGCDHSGRKNHGHRGDLGERNSDGNAFRNSGRYTNQGEATGLICRCGARRIDAQMGLEATPDEWIAGMVAVFRDVRRILRPDGTLWLNVGDSYNSQNGFHRGEKYMDGGAPRVSEYPDRSGCGLKPKDLLLMPARLALALQADGWWLRSDIIWAKPNPMPESVTDRPTSAHEHVFLLTKAARYFYDADAVREEELSPGRSAKEIERQNRLRAENAGRKPELVNDSISWRGGGDTYAGGRNLRNVWTIATEAFPEAHFATFPTELAERCIKAGTSERGCCAKCGAPWVRVSNTSAIDLRRPRDEGDAHFHGDDGRYGRRRSLVTETTGWTASCKCDAPTQPCTVLDPFSGAGTTALCADRLQRHAIGIELNPAYAAMARNRITQDAGLFAEVAD